MRRLDGRLAQDPESVVSDAFAVAAANVRDILTLAIGFDRDHAALIIADGASPLATLLTDAYRENLPDAHLIAYERHAPEDIIEMFSDLAPGDLVVLIQSDRFRLNAFRIRIELFKRGLKVIEHPHLGQMNGEEIDTYVDALAYDPDYYRKTGQTLKRLIDSAAGGTIRTGDALLTFASPFEAAKLNVGDYRHMKNVGGQFPIGEVFTEARHLEAVSGRVRIHFFGDRRFTVNRPERPITLIVEQGRVTDTLDASEEFKNVLDEIRADEGEILVRELGLGLNRAFSETRTVRDIGTFERICGIHLSLGAKHHAYPKPNIRKRDARYHVDVILENPTFWLDDSIVFAHGSWLP